MQGVSQKHKNYSYLKLFQSRSALFCISIIHIKMDYDKGE